MLISCVLFIRFPAGANSVEFGILESAMYRARRTTRPILPNNAWEYGRILETNERYSVTRDGHRFFKRFIQQGETSIIVFSSEILCQQALATTQEFHMDGTFKVVPNHFQQLFTVHAAAYGHVSCSHLYVF